VRCKRDQHDSRRGEETGERAAPARRPAQLNAQELLRLQAGAGNQAVGRMLQRRVIKVYKRNPKDENAAFKDHEEVNDMAKDDALAAYAGAVDANDLPTGGSLAAINAPEMVVLSGHGNVGRFNGYNGSEVAELLKTKWNLPKAYAGNIRLNSCKAGDDGVTFLRMRDPSLVETVSNSLVGYAATVEGMKGNVVVGGEDSASPGEPRSVGDDQAYANYGKIHREWKALKKLRDDELNFTGDGMSGPLAKAIGLQISVLEMELRQARQSAPNDTAIKAVLSWTTGASQLVQTLIEKIAALEEKQTIAQHKADVHTQLVMNKYADRLNAVLSALDKEGVPFGDVGLTVRHGPAQRPVPLMESLSQLSQAWVQFLQDEAAKMDQTLPV
jgi:hypothetical protein